MKTAPETTQPSASPVIERSAKAVTKFVRISPRKARLVIDPIRHKSIQHAFLILMAFKKKAARIVEKTLKSAVANAKVLGMDENRLVVADVRADGGPVMKRFMARSMGRADRILKRTTHLSLIVKEGTKVYKGAGAHAAAKSEEVDLKTAKKKAKSGHAKAGAKGS